MSSEFVSVHAKELGKIFVLVPILILLSSKLLPQPPIEPLKAYALQFAQLDEDFESHRLRTQETIKRWEGIRNRLLDAVGDAQSIQVAGIQQEFWTWLRANQLVEDAFASRNARSSRQVFGSEATERRMQTYLLADRTATFLTEASRLSELQFAKEATSERQQALITQLARESQHLQQAAKTSREFTLKYLEICDFFGRYSIDEYRAAYSALVNAGNDNEGARLARGIVLRRLGKLELAREELQLAGEPTTRAQALMQLMSAELLNAEGKTNEAKLLFGKITKSGRADALFFLLRGNAEAQNEDWNAAVRFWQRSLKLGGDEIGLRRNLAIVYATQVRQNKSTVRKALQHAELAGLLNLTEDWSVVLAEALALNADGDQAAAVEKAQEAESLANDECQDYCHQIVEKLKLDEPIEWDFLMH